MIARRPREGSIWEVLLFAILFVLAFSAIARADGGGLGSSMATTVALPAASAFTYIAEVDWTTSRKLLDNETDKPGYSGAYDNTLIITHKDTGISFMAEVEYDQEYTYQRDDGSTGSFTNPFFQLSKVWKNKKDFLSPVFDTISVSIHGVLPGNELAYEKTFMGGVGPGMKIAKKIGRFSLSESVSYSRNFFEYETAVGDAGAVNSPDSYLSISNISYSISNKWTWCNLLIYGYKVPYYGNGTGVQDYQSTIGYKISSNYSLAIGIDTSRGTSADDQQEQVRLYDENSTQAIVTLSVAI